MLKKISKAYFVVLLLIITLSAPTSPGAQVPNIILDTDFAPDIDDVAALAMLHILADTGEANILAVMASSAHRWSPGAIDAVNTYYGRPNLPIGGGQNSPQSHGQVYVKILANSNYGNNIKSIDDVPDSVSLYRKILNNQPDHSVTIVTVGFLTNLSDLIDTPANHKNDNIMRTGLQLVHEKTHQLIVMGGNYPAGTEFNFAHEGSSASGVGPYTKNTITNWPTPIVFLGGEIGHNIRTGSNLTDTPDNNPVRITYASYLTTENSRPSWDQTAVLYAVRGSSYGKIKYWTEISEGSNEIIDATGKNAWKSSPDKDHRYVVKSLPASAMARIIEELMVTQPAGGWPTSPVSESNPRRLSENREPPS